MVSRGVLVALCGPCAVRKILTRACVLSLSRSILGCSGGVGRGSPPGVVMLRNRLKKIGAKSRQRKQRRKINADKITMAEKSIGRDSGGECPTRVAGVGVPVAVGGPVGCLGWLSRLIRFVVDCNSIR